MGSLELEKESHKLLHISFKLFSRYHGTSFLSKSLKKAGLWPNRGTRPQTKFEIYKDANAHNSPTTGHGLIRRYKRSSFIPSNKPMYSCWWVVGIRVFICFQIRSGVEYLDLVKTQPFLEILTKTGYQDASKTVWRRCGKVCVTLFQLPMSPCAAARVLWALVEFPTKTYSRLYMSLYGI